MLLEIISKDAIRLIKKLIRASNKDGLERTFTVCKENSRYLIERGYKGTEDEVVISGCEKGRPYFIFHTHTIDKPYMNDIDTMMSNWSIKNSTHLSMDDIIGAINLGTRYSCVGSKYGVSLYKINKHTNTSFLEMLRDRKDIENFFKVILKDNIISEIYYTEISNL